MAVVRGGIGVLMFILLGLTQPVVADATSESTRLTGDISISDLPKDAVKTLPENLTDAQLEQIRQGQPSVILDGATLRLPPPTVGRSWSIVLSRIELRNRSRIVTNGVNLRLSASAIRSEDGAITAFDNSEGTSPAAHPGENGVSGLPAGTVVLQGSMDPIGVLHVRLDGQPGQGGGAGLKGPTGREGSRGENGADHLFDCAHGGGDGGRGSDGGQGGPGGQGGAGGAGGKLVLRGAIAGQREQIEFSGRGGRGGAGGPPGPAGDGGPGGSGGNGTSWCRGGHGGPSGSPGQLGAPGTAGTNGEDGGVTN